MVLYYKPNVIMMQLCFYMSMWAGIHILKVLLEKWFIKESCANTIHDIA